MRYRKWAPKSTYLRFSRISDLIALRSHLFICPACESRLPHRWIRRWEYFQIPDIHGVGACDGCGEHVRADIYLPDEEERGYAQQWREIKSIERAAIEDGTATYSQR